MTTQPPGLAAPLSRQRAFPLQWLLPALTAAVVIGVFAGGLLVFWAALRATTIESAHDRLTRSVHQLATTTAANIQASRARYSAVARDSAIRRALTSRGALAPAVSALSRLAAPADSGLAVELWTASGERVAWVGTAPARQPLPTVLRSIVPVDSLQVTPLYELGGRVYFSFVIPVVADGHAVGYVAHLRRIAGGSQAERMIRELTGDSVFAYYRNAGDGSVWATVGGDPSAGPPRDSSSVIRAEERVRGSPLALVIAQPLATIVAGPMLVLRRLALASALLTVIGAALAWLVGRRLARPLAELTDAAEAMSRGDYSVRVNATGANEVSRLARSFNHMAAQIGETSAELEAREAQFRAIANAIPQLAWMAHADGSVFWYNDRWFEYTGKSLEEMEGWGWQSLHNPARIPEVVARWTEAIKAGELFEMEFTIRGADGIDRWFLTRVQPVRGRDNEVIRWFGTNTDVHALHEAREAARAANRAKSDFLAAMSHELRTPLNAIGGYVELIEMELRGPVTEQQRRDLARIRASQAHLLGLISGILDMSRIESGRVAYDLRNVAVEPLLGDLDALIAPQAAAKQLSLEYERPRADLAVIADREKLRQILLNLLSNAIRYTPAGGRISISAAAGAGRTVAIHVRDNGPGIPVDRQAVIFEPFVQLDRSLTQPREGVGLGLAISRDLAAGMNGSLSVESTLDLGSCFTLTLPRGAIDSAAYAHTGEMPAARYGE